MKIVLGSVSLQTAVDALVVLVSEASLATDEVVAELDQALEGGLRAALRQDDWTAKKDGVYSVPSLGRLKARRLTLASTGPTARPAPADVRAAVARAARAAQADKAASLAVVLPDGADPATVRAAAEGVVLGAYRFTKYLTGDRVPKKRLEHATVALRGGRAGKPSAEHAAALKHGVAVAEAMNLARDLVNEPPNELTPVALAAAAHDVAKRHKLKITVLDRKGIEAHGMKLLAAVGQGSSNEPRFVHVQYAPAKARKGRKRVVVVGKGLTFDSGGLCIKPAPGMGDMKSDMAGAALAVAIMDAVAALKLDVEVHALVAAAENMPDGAAYRPGDVFGSLDGKTVEIINTDAEGRLVLADALAYARTLKPDVVIDHATLTGACIIALGNNTAGLFGNDDPLAEAYLAASRVSGESLWRLPLLEDLKDGLKSEVADLKHTGDRAGGSITAALFLREFVGDARWLHLDIAGPSLADRVTALAPKGATGFGLLTLVQYLESVQA